MGITYRHDLNGEIFITCIEIKSSHRITESGHISGHNNLVAQLG